MTRAIAHYCRRRCERKAVFVRACITGEGIVLEMRIPHASGHYVTVTVTYLEIVKQEQQQYILCDISNLREIELPSFQHF
jgi:hypothetical protein